MQKLSLTRLIGFDEEPPRYSNQVVPCLDAQEPQLAIGARHQEGLAAKARVAGEAQARPDVVSVQLSHTRSHVAFTVQFAHVPPLHVDARGAWIDMLLVGLDVPPLGPRPVSPGGEWRGADYALGAHGPSRRGTLVRLAADGRGRVLGRVDVVGHGSSLRFSIPRRALGNPTMFTFVVSAARERTEAPGGTFDVVPDRGTFRYSLVR